MSKVSEQLRQAREARKLTVHQVAEATKIRTDHIRALDEGNFDVFSAPVYIRGFVRTYAGFLRLDVPKIIEQLNEELAGSEKFRENPSHTGQKRGFLDVLMYLLSKINWRIALPVLGVALILLASVYGYRAWTAHKNRDPLADLGSGQYQPRSNTPDLLPIPTAPRR
jgi:cytoskeletal protein RodZ